MEKCFFLTWRFKEHEAKNSEGRSRSYCSRWAGAGCQKFGSFPAEGEVFFLDIPFYRTPLLHPVPWPKWFVGRSSQHVRWQARRRTKGSTRAASDPEELRASRELRMLRPRD